jgi:hypothetical protein
MPPLFRCLIPLKAERGILRCPKLSYRPENKRRKEIKEINFN